MKYPVVFLCLFFGGCLSATRVNNTAISVEQIAVVDSLVYTSETCDYACYFPKGKYDKEQLFNTVHLLIYPGQFNDKYSNIVSRTYDTEHIVDMEKYYDYVIDSVSHLKFLDFDPWVSFVQKKIAYNRSQFDRKMILAKGMNDPQTLYDYDGLEQDSIMKKCVDILVEGGDNIVEETRKYMTYLYRLPLMRNDSVSEERKYAIEYEAGLMLRRLTGEDSVRKAKGELIMTISNRINTQVHKKYDRFFATGKSHIYEREFHALFDSIRKFNMSEP